MQDNKNIVARVLDWLHAGYPDEVPLADRAAVMAVLRHNLTEAQLEEVVRKLMESRAARGKEHVTDRKINEYFRQVVDQVPTPEDIDRVARILGAGGLKISAVHVPEQTETKDANGKTVYVRYNNPDPEEIVIAESAAEAAGLETIGEQR